MLDHPSLPAAFCWTRFGTEAGEEIGRIFARKEQERLSTDGVFYWGIGNSVGPGISELLKRVDSPELLFSPIKSRPRAIDVNPDRVVRWRRGITLDGDSYELPETIFVTSGQNSVARPHYALVCSSSAPLVAADLGRLYFGGLRNLVSGNALGASQVTAVVSRSDETAGAEYTVAVRVNLVAPYFVRLADPEVLS